MGKRSADPGIKGSGPQTGQKKARDRNKILDYLK